LRMDPHICAGQTGQNTQLVSRNGCLSREPLLFIQYFADGRAANSWATPCSVGAVPRIISPNLGYTQLTLQVRGGFNTSSALNFHPNVNQVGSGDRNFAATPFPNPSLTPNQSLPYEAATSDDNGRRILINNANGRITVENYAPYLIDVPDGEDDEPNWRSPNNNKEWI
ncbi:MAG TPA: hypothetical protein VEI97_20535, partial [bacterium]|nr:hypothetical protein [bacterium]